MKNLKMALYLLKKFPKYVIGYFLNEILLELPQYVANVLFLKYLIQALTEQKSIYYLLFIVMALAGFLIVSDLYSSYFMNILQPCEEERINKKFYYNIRNAAECYELHVYDDPVFYDDMTYVSNNIVKDALASLSYISKIIAGFINVSLILGLFYEIGAGVLVISIGSVILSFLFNLPVIKLNNQKRYEINSMERKKSYFFNSFFMRDYFMERKMTVVGQKLHSRYGESIAEQLACNQKYGIKLFAINTLKELFSSNILLNLILLAYLLYEILVTKKLLGSDFIATYNAVMVIISTITQIVQVFEKMKESSFTIKKYQDFMQIMPEKESNIEKDLEEVHSIEFRKVSFSYPETDKMVLKDITFSLRIGDKIAIVGKNGSGKTTLVHLLMGLYYPTQGEILINGRVLEKEEYPVYRRRFAAFFQGMKPLEATIAQNVALDTETNTELVYEALSKTNCELLLNKPESAMVGVQFDSQGLVLSGGECQKLMLTYCFYSGKSLIVMDEPSSALDPKAEHEFNNQVADLSDDKISIFVTHRLSTVYMVNQIYVIDDGKLCAQGTHEELMKKGGLYREMWDVQAEKYC